MKKSLTIKTGDKIKIGPFDCIVENSFIRFNEYHSICIDRIKRL
jgi:hypothetical protein